MTRLITLLLYLLLTACGEAPPPAGDIAGKEAGNTDPARASVEADLHQHIAVLASDEFEGRAPATPGEEKTVEYLAREFAALGLEPGNGTDWYQGVPVTSVTTDSSTNEPMPMPCLVGFK